MYERLSDRMSAAVMVLRGAKGGEFGLRTGGERGAVKVKGEPRLELPCTVLATSACPRLSTSM